MSDSVLNTYRSLRANRNAVAKAYTAPDAFSLPTEHKLCRLAGLNTDVIHFVRGMLTVAVTMHDGNSFNDVADLNTEYIGNCRCRSVTTGDTEICGNSVTLRECLCVAVTACISARTAVSAGKTLAYFCIFFVLLNGKRLRSHDQHYRTNRANTDDDRDGN